MVIIPLMLMMPATTEVIDLADDDDDLDEQYESISIPDDIEEKEGLPTAGPSREREAKSSSEEKTSGYGEKFDAEQVVRGKVAKLDVEVRLHTPALT